MANASKRIKPKIKVPKNRDVDFSAEDTWLKLSKNIREIHNHNAANLSFEENYRYGYNLVLHKNGPMLYSGVNRLVTENLDSLANREIVPVFPAGSSSDPVQQSQEGEVLLKALRRVWDDHTGCMSQISDILKYMDRVYTKGDNILKIGDLGLKIFYDRVIRPPFKGHLISAILKQIHVEREGHMINRSAVKECVDVFLRLSAELDGSSVYERDLEPVMLEESDAYYKAEGEKLIASCDSPEFLRRVEVRFQSEEDRTNYYLSSKTGPRLRQILENDLITPHLQAVIDKHNSGLDNMIDLENTGDLARLYHLFIKVPSGLPCLRSSLKKSIIRRGTEINRTALGTDTSSSSSQLLAQALKWVQEILDLKDKFDQVWKQAMQCDRDIESSYTEAFESFINGNERSPEFISLFIDDHLKKGLKGKSDAEVENILDKTITIFRYIVEKDVFERYYKGHLAKRLLLGRSVSDDAERGMLAKLKVECGFQFTQKLEGMFHDMKISEETMRAYRSYLEKTMAPEVDLSVIVMTSTFWPTQPTNAACTLPAELTKCCRSFEQFYLSRHSGRKLTWQTSLGNADVRATFKKRKHDLNVSTFALAILLLFQDEREGEFLTYEEIKAGTNIVDNELQRHLQSLACAKFKILKKHPPGREVNLDDSFSFNHDFESQLMKIKISTIASKVETNEERKETQDRVDEERRYATEACIVRVMKDRKHLTHNDLINEVTRQLGSRFNPNPALIKKRIEHLIEREYLARCDDRKSYNYVA